MIDTIQLPCTIGDIVYTNYAPVGYYLKAKDRPYEVEIVFIGINKKEDFFNVRYLKRDIMESFKFNQIGTDIFLTKEEAIQKLKEGEK